LKERSTEVDHLDRGNGSNCSVVAASVVVVAFDSD